MADRFPGGVISKTPPEVVPPVNGEGGSASGVWTLDEVLGYEKAGGWPKKTLPRELYAWGGNTNGTLGDGTVVNRSSPVQIGALVDWSSALAIGGTGHALAVKTNNTLWSWGRNLTGSPGNFRAGMLGHNDTINRSSPVQVGALTNWYQVAAGDVHSLAVKTDGTLWSWGGNYRSELGFYTSGQSRSSPIQVGASSDWYQVSGGLNFSVAIKTDGTLWSWGFRSYGRLGDNYGSFNTVNSPTQRGSLTDWHQVSAGDTHCAAIKTDGTLWAWGRNLFGAVGDDTTEDMSSPVQIGSLTNWAQVESGQNNSFAVKTDGTLWAWGVNSSGSSGQLGLGDVANRSSPVQVGALTNWAQVSGGTTTTSAVKTDGTLWAWGNDVLGDNTTVSKSSPIQIGALTNWSKVETNSSTLAITVG
jgi:alpha-tubulin suppressor-like RCC1 family protein